MAVAGVYLAGWRPLPDAEFDDPVRCGRPPVFALPPFGFSLLGCCDLLPDPVEGYDEVGLQGAEAWQVRRQIVHVFESSVSRCSRVDR